uniref:Uncharacterized protein n=1 Tax=Monodelphis domestica TaxID=13616 RepID=A0A5F8GFJ0_MONDO
GGERATKRFLNIFGLCVCLSNIHHSSTAEVVFRKPTMDPNILDKQRVDGAASPAYAMGTLLTSDGRLTGRSMALP